jgi:hypothetical protein
MNDFNLKMPPKPKWTVKNWLYADAPYGNPAVGVKIAANTTKGLKRGVVTRCSDTKHNGKLVVVTLGGVKEMCYDSYSFKRMPKGMR